ncbi:hypothetical protein GYO_3265 [Bacillus spizizenii TU-B-10]|uniref:Uncharacterized protein n=1 Tax=Bacillus spizizenii (strain DSM 15029 / JCM 12233 / NBRC 101239 / NRRL B-23049 / TU-B-10) TaxID=1052585 RepID=G4NZN8_BACS4|nr:hypothetical protein GYO_3265 [Bacillus spizizenii TU-B-10]
MLFFFCDQFSFTAAPAVPGDSVQMIIDMAITDLLHFRHDIVTCCSSFKKE